MKTLHPAADLLPEHVHERSYATFVLEGAYTETIGQDEMRAARGSVVVHPPGECHSNRFAGRNAILLNVELPESFSFQPPSRLHGTGDPLIRIFGRKLLRELKSPDDVSKTVVEAVMLELCATLMRRAARSSGTRVLTRKAEMLIQERCAEPITLRDIAADLRVDSAHLARVFRRETGCTVGERIRQLRMERASEMLGCDLPLAEVADAAGFADQSHFTRSFRAAFGCTPGEYRRVASIKGVPSRSCVQDAAYPRM